MSTKAAVTGVKSPLQVKIQVAVHNKSNLDLGPECRVADAVAAARNLPEFEGFDSYEVESIIQNMTKVA